MVEGMVVWWSSVMSWTCMAANGAGSLVFIDDVTANRSSRMNPEVNSSILSARIQSNAAELMGKCFTVRMDNYQKYSVKGTLEPLKAMKCNILSMA